MLLDRDELAGGLSLREGLVAGAVWLACCVRESDRPAAGVAVWVDRINRLGVESA